MTKLRFASRGANGASWTFDGRLWTDADAGGVVPRSCAAVRLRQSTPPEGGTPTSLDSGGTTTQLRDGLEWKHTPW